MMRSPLIVVVVCLGCLLLGFAVCARLAHREANDVGQVRVLPDGSKLRLERVLFTSQAFSYSILTGGKPVHWILSKLPLGLRKKLKIPGGGVGYGGAGPGNTNLLVVTINRQPNAKGMLSLNASPGRLRVCDDYGDRSDECWSGGSFGPPGVIGQLWVVSAFPRRGKTITLECLATNAVGGWTTVAKFRVPNPVWSDYPQWNPERLPATRQNQDLAITLEAFQSGLRMPAPAGLGDAASAGRKTRLVFSLLENGKSSSDWSLNRLTFSDATGNHWSPSVDAAYLDPGRSAIEIYRAIWPSERAWKVGAEFLRSGAMPESRTVEFLVRPDIEDDM